MTEKKKTIPSRIEDKTCVVNPAGYVASSNAVNFNQLLLDFCEDTSIESIIVNMKGVEFIDSSGLGTIIQTHNNLHQRGAKLYVTDLKPEIEGVFKITSLHKIITMLPTEKDAFEAIDQG